MRSPSLIAIATVTLALTGCDPHLEAKVGGAILAQAVGASAAGAGPTVVVRRDHPPGPLPAGPVRLAIDLATPWPQVRPILDGAAATGSQPILLVGQRDQLRAFVIDDAPGAAVDPARAIKVVADDRGKFCLSPPDTEEAYCVESGDRRHISSMYVREAVRKAVLAYGLTTIRIRPKGDLMWGDLVRTVDGARTCCPLRQVTVTLAR